MKITLELKTLDDVKILTNKLLLSSEEAHDCGDDPKEELFIGLWRQALKQLETYKEAQ